MAFDLTTQGLRDREYSKFIPLQAGSQTSVSTNSNNNIKVYEFPIGSLTALDTGAPISGGNFQSFTDYPLNGLLHAIEFVAGNNTATGSLALFTSGNSHSQIWATITRTTNESFTVFPRGSLVTTTDIDLSESGLYGLIPMNSVLHLVGSDFGIGKSGLALRIAYI